MTFTPSASGTLAATISVTDNATGTPQTATLTGTGVAPDFALTVPAPSQTLSSTGGSVQYTIAAAGSNGTYSSPITFSVTGLPAGATAAFVPSTITPGSASASTTLIITVSPLAGASQPPSLFSSGTALIPAALAGLLLCCFKPRRLPALTARLRLFLLAASVFGLGALTGCGGGFRQPSAIQPGTFTLTVTGTSSTGQHSTSITLVVK